MSNTGKGLFNFFKKSPKRDSNEGNRHIRRSRTSNDTDSFGPITPYELITSHLKNMDSQLAVGEKKTVEDQKRAQRLERQLRKKEHIRKIEERKAARERILEQEMSSERQQDPISPLSLMYGGLNKTNQQVAEPDDDFKRDIESLESQIDNLDLRSKVMATMWIGRLRAPVKSEDEIRARNIITAHLLKCRKENIFQKEPFNMPPTSDTLANIMHKMYLTPDTLCHDLTQSKRLETMSYLNKLFHESYDGGKFLSQLPVPRDGAFFILHMRPNL